jgi:hypothetical protein
MWEPCAPLLHVCRTGGPAVSVTHVIGWMRKCQCDMLHVESPQTDSKDAGPQVQAVHAEWLPCMGTLKTEYLGSLIEPDNGNKTIRTVLKRRIQRT